LQYIKQILPNSRSDSESMASGVDVLEQLGFAVELFFAYIAFQGLLGVLPILVFLLLLPLLFLGHASVCIVVYLVLSLSFLLRAFIVLFTLLLSLLLSLLLFMQFVEFLVQL